MTTIKTNLQFDGKFGLVTILKIFEAKNLVYLRIPWRFLASASEIGIREDSDKHIRASGESQTSDKLKESLDALP